MASVRESISELSKSDQDIQKEKHRLEIVNSPFFFKGLTEESLTDYVLKIKAVSKNQPFLLSIPKTSSKPNENPEGWKECPIVLRALKDHPSVNIFTLYYFYYTYEDNIGLTTNLFADDFYFIPDANGFCVFSDEESAILYDETGELTSEECKFYSSLKQMFQVEIAQIEATQTAFKGNITWNTLKDLKQFFEQFDATTLSVERNPVIAKEPSTDNDNSIVVNYLLSSNSDLIKVASDSKLRQEIAMNLGSNEKGVIDALNLLGISIKKEKTILQSHDKTVVFSNGVTAAATASKGEVKRAADNNAAALNPLATQAALLVGNSMPLQDAKTSIPSAGPGPGPGIAQFVVAEPSITKANGVAATVLVPNPPALPLVSAASVTSIIVPPLPDLPEPEKTKDGRLTRKGMRDKLLAEHLINVRNKALEIANTPNPGQYPDEEWKQYLELKILVHYKKSNINFVDNSLNEGNKDYEYYELQQAKIGSLITQLESEIKNLKIHFNALTPIVCNTRVPASRELQEDFELIQKQIKEHEANLNFNRKECHRITFVIEQILGSYKSLREERRICEKECKEALEKLDLHVNECNARLRARHLQQNQVAPQAAAVAPVVPAAVARVEVVPAAVAVPGTVGAAVEVPVAAGVAAAAPMPKAIVLPPNHPIVGQAPTINFSFAAIKPFSVAQGKDAEPPENLQAATQFTFAGAPGLGLGASENVAASAAAGNGSLFSLGIDKKSKNKKGGSR